MLPLVASGLAADEIGPLEASVRQTVEAHFGARALPAKDVAARLERGGAKGLRCDRLDPACSAQLGAVCGVERVLVASLSIRPASSTLSFRLIDVGDATQLAHASGKVSDAVGAEEVMAVLRALEEPAASSTSLRVRGPVGSLLVVDGSDRGALPMAAPLTDLAPGPHEVGLDGPSTFRKTIELKRGEPVVVEAPAPRVSPAATASGASADATPTASAAPVPSGPAPHLVTVIGGASASVVGAVTMGAGLVPFFVATQSAQRLADREARALQDPSVLESEAAQIREDHASVVAANGSWASWGGLATLVGGAVIVTGLAATGVGIAMWPE